MKPISTAAMAAGRSAAKALDPRRRGRRAPAGLAAALAVLAVLAAACSGGAYGSADPYGAAPTTSSGARAAAVVDVRASALGRTLVDGQGRTLYLFEADQAGKSRCDGGCAAAWPPYLGGTPRAGTGVTGSLLGTATRGDGGTQVTYSGHPLYYYAGDAQPGDHAGQGLDQFGAAWYVLGPDGAKIDTD